jgi:hypothetical protein
MLRDWIRDEVTPLGGQAQGRARAALRRKADVLRRQAIAALERHTKLKTTHSRSTTSRNNDVHRSGPVSHGVGPGFQWVSDTGRAHG